MIISFGSWIQVAEMGFLFRVVGLNLRDRERNSDILRELGVEALLLGIKGAS